MRANCCDGYVPSCFGCQDSLLQLGTSCAQQPARFVFYPKLQKILLLIQAKTSESGREYFRLGAESYSSLGRVVKFRFPACIG